MCVPTSICQNACANINTGSLQRSMPLHLLQLGLSEVDVRDGTVLPDMDVEPVRSVVLSHHRAWRDDPVSLGQLTLREGLSQWSGQYLSKYEFAQCE